MTNKEAKKLIRAAERGYKGVNVTRWYSTIHPKRNGEARIRTWAVKTWRGKPLIMLAAEYHTDGASPCKRSLPRQQLHQREDVQLAGLRRAFAHRRMERR